MPTCMYRLSVGQFRLTDIRNSHLDIHSVSGNVTIRNVTGPSVEVNAG